MMWDDEMKPSKEGEEFQRALDMAKSEPGRVLVVRRSQALFEGSLFYANFNQWAKRKRGEGGTLEIKQRPALNGALFETDTVVKWVADEKPSPLAGTFYVPPRATRVQIRIDHIDGQIIAQFIDGNGMEVS